jgi:hypothetical protein
MTHTKAPWRIGDAGNTVFGPPEWDGDYKDEGLDYDVG